MLVIYIEKEIGNIQGGSKICFSLYQGLNFGTGFIHFDCSVTEQNVGFFEIWLFILSIFRNKKSISLKNVK